MSGIPTLAPAGFSTSSAQFVGMMQVALLVGKMNDSGSPGFVRPNFFQPLISSASPGGTATLAGIFTMPATFPDHSLTLWVAEQKERSTLKIHIPFSRW